MCIVFVPKLINLYRHLYLFHFKYHEMNNVNFVFVELIEFEIVENCIHYYICRAFP